MCCSSCVVCYVLLSFAVGCGWSLLVVVGCWLFNVLSVVCGCVLLFVDVGSCCLLLFGGRCVVLFDGCCLRFVVVCCVLFAVVKYCL